MNETTQANWPLLITAGIFMAWAISAEYRLWSALDELEQAKRLNAIYARRLSLYGLRITKAKRKRVFVGVCRAVGANFVKSSLN